MFVEDRVTINPSVPAKISIHFQAQDQSRENANPGPTEDI